MKDRIKTVIDTNVLVSACYKQKDLYDLFESDTDFIAADYDYKEMRGGCPNDIA